MREITEERINKLNTIFDSYEMVAEGTDVYVCDMRYDYSRWARTAVELYGLESEYMYAADDIWEDHIHPDDRKMYRDSIKELFENGYGMHDVQYRARDISGQYYTCTCRGIIIKDDNDEPEYFVGMIRNHSINESVDNITGLRNKNGFFYDINRYLKSHIPIRIVMYGSTNYTRINDLFGYDFGTRIFQHCIRYVLDHNQKIGDLYRLDGIRVALISRTATIEELRDNYEHYQSILERPFLFEGEQVIININAGAIAVDRFDINADTVLSCLTQAYQESKHNNQGKFCFFENGVNKNGIHKLERINRIRNSVAEGCDNFVVYYQPVIDAKTGKLSGAEALIRWKDESGNIVMPNDFIPVLENDALFPSLGEWILKHSMEECLPVLKKCPQFMLNVNLSYAQLQQLDFVNVVKRAIKDTGYPAANLCLEMTERCRFIDMDQLKVITSGLEQEGIKIALDDFGTGFSSLEILQNLHIDIVKIDRQFVKNISEDSRQIAIVKIVNELAEVYNAITCAEGVETEEMRDILRNCDVHTMQGYLYSKPIPFEQFTEKFVKSNECI
ncbi:EAL domain, c-di-GMP-specific phosphodiesterase class I (or its enzymatically inactive variant) [Oribacterium sp. WCC10]|nr:EAL domain, c-di-GMP-specific phosphodiesterase class I (or its enzymatically inactive variant) [Oribacterium sp. WCC10]